jgi:hypothetical protein
MSFIHEVLTYGNEIVQHALDAVNGCGNDYHLAYFIFGLGITNNEEYKRMTDKFFEENPQLKNIPPIQSVVEFIYHDNFQDGIPCNPSNIRIWERLEPLKQNLINFYTHNVCESNTGGQFHEFHTKFYQMSLQLKRLRLVIQPEFHVIKNVHPVSKIPYLSVRGFWLDDNDKKVKIFTKSLGREDKLDDWKNDEVFLASASNQIQELAYAKYKELYS